MTIEFFGEALLLGRKRSSGKNIFSMVYSDPFTMKVESQRARRSWPHTPESEGVLGRGTVGRVPGGKGFLPG